MTSMTSTKLTTEPQQQQPKQKMTPPKHLSKETLIVWEGWSKMGLREVVRESAAKGSHVQLAYKFLQQRKEVSLENVQIWFKDEVTEWVIELLRNKQIFRASHILKNISLDPFTEITNIMLNTSDEENMNFLASHLEKNGQLKEEIKLNMRLLNRIGSDEEFLKSFKLECNIRSSDKVTLKMLLDCDTGWKSKMVARLFLKYYDFTLCPLLSASYLWSYAIESNDKAFLKIWLEIQHATASNADHTEEDELTIVLTDFPINEEMYSELHQRTDILLETKEFVYDILSKFGRFNSDELQDVHKIIARICKNALNENIEEILKQPTATISYNEFKHRMKEYCVENKQFIVLDACLQDEDYLFSENNQDDQALSLLKSCKDVALNPNNKNVLTVNLKQINQFLQHPEEDEFQPLLQLFLAKLEGHDVQKFLMSNTPVLYALPTVHIVLNKIMTNIPTCGITRYDLLRKHMKIDVDDLFPYRFDKNPMERPNFKSAELVKLHGHHKTLDYASFLFHCRPGKALKLVEKDNLNVIEGRVRRLLIKNFQRDDIAASCMYFLDCMNIPTNELKIEVAVAKLLHEKKGLAEMEVQNLLLSGNKHEIIKLYEEIIFPTENNTNEEFIDNYIKLESVIKLAIHYGCKLPELYLEQLANESKWIEFLFIIHKFEYPQDQVNKLVTSFTNHALYDHLSHALAHDLVFEAKNVLMRDRDARKFFLARIGLLKHVESDMMSSVTSQSSWGSNTSSSGLSDYIIEVECSDDSRTDLLQVLIRCHNSNDPPKALLYACQHYKYPLLAVLATTYEPDSVVTCWLTWLSISCDIAVENCERLATVGSNVTEFLQKVVAKRFYKTLRQSMSIFLRDNPLKIFLDFLVDCQYLNFDVRAHYENLKVFHRKLTLKRSNSYVPEMDHEMLYLNNKLWIESTAITLLATALNSYDKPFQRVQLLKTMMELDLQKYFFTKLPNLMNLYKYFNYMHDHQIVVTLNFHKLLDSSQYHDEIKTCISTMLAEEKYEEALNVAQLERIMIDEILMKKWQSTTKEDQETELHWHRCDEEFTKYAISAENAVLFYHNACISDDLLRYKILTLAYSWCRKFKLEKQQDIELEMWRTYLNLSQPNIAMQIDAESNKSYLEMKTEIEQITTHHVDELSEKETEKLDAVVHKLLSSGSIFQALRLQKLFITYSNMNLDIFRLCYSLAEGLKLPIQLTAQERILIKKVKNNRTYSHRRKPLFSFRLSSSASRSPASSLCTIMELEPKVQDTLSLLDNLIEGLSSGTELGERILMTYRISINTNVSYNNILLIEEPTGLLLDAVKYSCPNKIEVVHDFFCIYNWNKEQIADFLCEQLITAINTCTKLKEESPNIMWDINLDQEIHLILQLLPDSCSKLGIKLYSYSSALHKAITITNEMTNIFELTVVIELLILSHECYTYDCNMEGISIILKKCQILINLLLALKNWTLIVRLLTGVGRYNELNYVFHILRDNDQFEFLLRKGSAKDNGLRVALLDYLKKFCSDNRALYEMVALYFSLYSEVAQLWEAESRQSIKNLIAISKLEMINRKINPDECIFVEFSNTEGTKLCLSKVMENYSHAAQYHLQGEKLAKAMNAAQQAELIALQISLIKAVPNNATTKCILNLTTLQIAALFSTLSFQQALIVTEAFNYQADWPQILFEHFIVNNDTKYFDNYLMTFNITDSFIHNLSRHYLSKNVPTEHGARNMKLILNLLPSIHTQYRIASELRFTDLVEKLLNSDKLNYLKDTVWKRGYRE